MYKKLIAALIAFVMILGIAACSSQNTPESTAGTSAQSETGSEAETTADYDDLTLLERMRLDYNSIPDDLPAADYDGYNFVICPKALDYSIINGEDSADVVDSAIYQKTLAVEERFNVSITQRTFDYKGYSKFLSNVTKDLKAQDNAFELMENWSTMLKTFAVQGLLADLSSIDTINFGKPWFISNAIKRISYKNHIYGSVDFLSNTMLEDLSCTYFNKDMAENYNVGDLYQVVRDGKWTFEYMKGLCQDMYSDLDGNGAVDTDTDQFGYEMPTAQFSYAGMPAMGIYIIGKDADDVPQLALSSNMELFDKAFTEIKEFTTQCSAVTYADWDNEVFSHGRAFMFSHLVRGASSYRSLDFDIGILPQYKFDESQENYMSAFLPNTSSIPASCPDLERAGVIFSALAEGGYKTVTPAYFEIAIKTKASGPDEESAEMLDIIASNVTTDGVVMYADSYVYMFLDFIQGKTDLTTFWAKRESGTAAAIAKECATLDEVVAAQNG